MSHDPAAALAAARQRERFTLRQLAEVTGIRHVRLCYIEHGKPASYLEARILAAALRVPIASLLPTQPTTEAATTEAEGVGNGD